MEYTLTVGEKTYSAALSFGSIPNDPEFYVSYLMSNELPALPVFKKDLKPLPSGYVLKNFEDTDDIVWIPFPYHFYDGIRRYPLGDSKYPVRNIYEDIVNGIMTKEALNNIIWPYIPKNYLLKNFDKYVEVLKKYPQLAGGQNTADSSTLACCNS